MKSTGHTFNASRLRFQRFFAPTWIYLFFHLCDSIKKKWKPLYAHIYGFANLVQKLKNVSAQP